MKSKMLSFTLLFLLCVFAVKGQNESLFADFQTGNYHSEWSLYQETEQVAVYYKYSDCSDPANGLGFEYLLFRVENKTQQKIYLYWNWQYAYDGIVTSDEGSDEDLNQVMLEPGQSVESDCFSLEYKNLKLFVKDKNIPGSSRLTAFDMTDLNVFEL